MGTGKPSVEHFTDYSVSTRLKLIQDHCDLHNKTVLDLGCGNGIYTIELAKHAGFVVGIDDNKTSLDKAIFYKESMNVTNISFICSTIEEFRCEKKFDIVTIIEVLDHVKDESIILGKIDKYLVEGGILILFVPNKFYPFEVHGMTIFGKSLHFRGSVPFLSWAPYALRKKLVDARIYTRGSLDHVLKENGFEIIAVDYMFPPLDLINLKFFHHLRGFFDKLQKSPLKIFGMSLFCMAKKSKGD